MGCDMSLLLSCVLYTHTISAMELWDVAFSEVMLAQQNTIARLLTDIEEAQQITEKIHARQLHYDPLNTIGSLRSDHVCLRVLSVSVDLSSYLSSVRYVLSVHDLSVLQHCV